jgi:hypothetical protein
MTLIAWYDYWDKIQLRWDWLVTCNQWIESENFNKLVRWDNYMYAISGTTSNQMYMKYYLWESLISEEDLTEKILKIPAKKIDWSCIIATQFWLYCFNGDDIRKGSKFIFCWWWQEIGEDMLKNNPNNDVDKKIREIYKHISENFISVNNNITTYILYKKTTLNTFTQ